MPRIQTDRLTMWYESFAPTAEPKQDAPILLIGGFSMQATHWPDSLIQGLTGRGFRVIIFDNRDIGLSDRIQGQRAPSPDRFKLRSGMVAFSAQRVVAARRVSL